MKYYRVNIVRILLNKQCKLSLTPSSTPNYNLNKHLSFSCMLSIMEYSSKLSMRWEMPDNTHYCIAGKVKNYYKVNIEMRSRYMRCK
jgi:hypothetical protein